MRLRYAPIFIYIAVFIYVLLLSVSDYFFGTGDGKRLLTRLGAAVVWPLAMLSNRGREFLFKQGVGL